MITSPPSFSSVACLGLGPFFRSVTAGLRLFTVVPGADYRFLFIELVAAGLCCFLLFWLLTVGQRFLFHCQVNGCLRSTLFFRLVTVGLLFRLVTVGLLFKLVTVGLLFKLVTVGFLCQLVTVGLWFSSPALSSLT